MTTPDRRAPLVTSPADWRGADLRHRPDRWLYQLAKPEVAELARAIAHVRSLGRELRQITTRDFRLEVLAPALADWFGRLEHGLGFVLVRGFPAREWSRQDTAIAYWIIGRHLGEPVPQNTAGELLVDVRDTGAAANDHNTRLYRTRAELTFHTDGADIIGLQCLRAAKAGGVSRICSSVHVYNEIVRRRPDLAPLMFDVYQHHAHGQFGPTGPPTFPYPIVTLKDKVFRMFLLPWYIRNAAADFPQVARLSDAQRELLDLLEAIPLEDGVALDMSFQPGDMQFLKNSVILHARSDYQDHVDPDEKRHLLRLWLAARRFRDGDEFLRRGVGQVPVAARARTSEALNALPPMAQSPLSNSLMRTHVTGRMLSPSTSIIAAVTFAMSSCFCFGVKTSLMTSMVTSGMSCLLQAVSFDFR